MSESQICRSGQIRLWFHWGILTVLSLLLEWCDATKKATMKTTQVCRIRSNSQCHCGVQTYWHPRKLFHYSIWGDLHYFSCSTGVEELQCQLHHHTSLSPVWKWALLKQVSGLTDCNPDTQNLPTKGAPRVVLFHMRHSSSATCWFGSLVSLSATIFIQAKASPGFSPRNPKNLHIKHIEKMNPSSSKNLSILIFQKHLGITQQFHFYLLFFLSMSWNVCNLPRCCFEELLTLSEERWRNLALS
jgi:hypothetical protein